MDFSHLIIFFQEWIQNVAILVLVGLLYNLIPDRVFLSKKALYRFLVGVIFSIAAIIGIYFTSNMGSISGVRIPGEILSGSPGPGAPVPGIAGPGTPLPDVPAHGIGINGVLLPLAGYIGGILSTVVAAGILILADALFVGGNLAPPDVAVILSAFIIGPLFYYTRGRVLTRLSPIGKLAVFSMVVAGVTVSMFFVFPIPGSGLGLLQLIEHLQVFGLLFLTTFIMGWVMQLIDRRKESEFALIAYRDHLELLVEERTYELEREKALKSATIEATGDGIVVVDFKGGIQDYNTAADHILDITSQKGVMGDEMSVLVLIKNKVSERDLIENPSLQTPPSIEESLTTQLSFRSGRIFEVNITPYLMRGEINGRVMNFRDITEKKHAEEMLKNYNQKLLLLSSITRHDILNKIVSMKLYLQLAKEDTHGRGMVDYLEKMDRTVSLIREQAEFTRDYQDLGLHDATWQNPRVVFDKASESFSDSGVTFSSHGSDLEILADPLLERVFYNFIDNSIRHGKHVTTVTLSVFPGEEHVTLLYEDDGEGIPPEEKEKIFASGFGKNTGFGLFLIREILSITGIGIRENGTFSAGVRFEMLVPKGKFRLIASH